MHGRAGDTMGQHKLKHGTISVNNASVEPRRATGDYLQDAVSNINSGYPIKVEHLISYIPSV